MIKFTWIRYDDSIPDANNSLFQKTEIFDRYRIKTMAIFGSFARNEQRPDSDVDILVEFDAPIGVEFIDLADHLERLLERRIDLVSRNGIKPRYFEYIKNELRYV